MATAITNLTNQNGSPSTHREIVDPKTVADPLPRASEDGFDPANDLHGDVPVDQNIPTEADLARIADLQVFDKDGKAHSFKSLYAGEADGEGGEGGEGGERQKARRMVIFIRHFFCGMCQEFIRTLTSSLTPSLLLSQSPPIHLSIIGCGQPDLIPLYTSMTSCTFPLYADPSRRLYDELGMTSTLAPGSKPEYIQSAMLTNAVRSIIQGLKAGTAVRKGGNYSQVGGEFLFDEGGRCVWAHRMRNTRDHVEVAELKRLFGMVDLKTNGGDGVKEKGVNGANGVNGVNGHAAPHRQPSSMKKRLSVFGGRRESSTPKSSMDRPSRASTSNW